MVRLTTKIKQLEAEKGTTLKTLDEIDHSLLNGTIHEPTYKELKRKYESRLILIEQDIFELEKNLKQKQRKKKKANTKAKMKNKKPPRTKPTITLEGLKLRRDYIQKTVGILENNHTMHLDQAITALLTEKSQMGLKLTASEITEELRRLYYDQMERITKNEVILCLRALVSDGQVKRMEDAHRHLRYYMDLSWKVGSLLKGKR